MTERTVTVADVVAAVHRRYDPAGAEPWDAVGLVCGDPAAPVRRVHLAVDPTPEVALEAVDAGADLLLTHHPLLLRPVSAVACLSSGSVNVISTPASVTFIAVGMLGGFPV